MHVHGRFCICKRLICILVNQDDALWVRDLNYGDAAVRQRRDCTEEYGDLSPSLRDLYDHVVTLGMVIKRGGEVTPPIAVEVRRFHQPKLAHKTGAPEMLIKKGVECA